MILSYSQHELQRDLHYHLVQQKEINISVNTILQRRAIKVNFLFEQQPHARVAISCE
jgi:hypothetical protein